MASGFGRRLARVGTFLLYGGTRRFKIYESEVLRNLESHLDSADRVAVRAQLDSLDHLKRLHVGRLVTFYFFDEHALPRLGDVEGERCLGSFELSADGLNLSVDVISYCGLLSSMEFSKSPKALKNIPFKVTFVGRRKKTHSVVDAAERLEHGVGRR